MTFHQEHQVTDPGPRARVPGVVALTVVTPRAIARDLPVKSLVLQPDIAIPIGTPVLAQEGKFVNTNTSELLTQMRKLREKVNLRQRQDHVPEASALRGQGKRHASSLLPACVSGVANALVSMVAVTPLLRLPHHRRRLRLRARPRPMDHGWSF